MVNISIAVYILFIELDKFIDIYWTYNNDLEKYSSTLIHGKEPYKCRELFVLSFDVGKYFEKFKSEQLKLYDKYSTAFKKEEKYFYYHLMLEKRIGNFKLEGLK